jgi:GAF domain-containing protein
MALHEHIRHTPILSTSEAPIRMIGAFAESVGQATGLPQVGECILRVLSEQLRLPEAAIWIRDADGQYHLLASLGHSTRAALPASLPDNHALVTSLSDRLRLLRYDQTSSSPAGSAMMSIQAAVCLPLRNKTQLLGLCTLGPIGTNCHLDEETVIIAETVARIACNALEHHLAQDDLRRSSTLMRRTDRLRSLEIMAGGFAHESATPSPRSRPLFN